MSQKFLWLKFCDLYVMTTNLWLQFCDLKIVNKMVTTILWLKICD